MRLKLAELDHLLQPVQETAQAEDVRQAVEGIREFQRGRRLGPMSLDDLLQEGRKR